MQRSSGPKPTILPPISARVLNLKNHVVEWLWCNICSWEKPFKCDIKTNPPKKQAKNDEMLFHVGGSGLRDTMKGCGHDCQGIEALHCSCQFHLSSWYFVVWKLETKGMPPQKKLNNQCRTHMFNRYLYLLHVSGQIREIMCSSNWISFKQSEIPSIISG